MYQVAVFALPAWFQDAGCNLLFSDAEIFIGGFDPTDSSISECHRARLCLTNLEALGRQNDRYQKTRQTFSGQPGKDNFLFFKRLRTHQDIPKLKSGSSDWMRYLIYLFEF